MRNVPYLVRQAHYGTAECNFILRSSSLGLLMDAAIIRVSHSCIPIDAMVCRHEKINLISLPLASTRITQTIPILQAFSKRQATTPFYTKRAVSSIQLKDYYDAVLCLISALWWRVQPFLGQQDLSIDEVISL